MKKNVKKILAVALAAVALGSFLAGCGTDTDKGAATAEKKVVTVGVNPGSGEQIMEQVAKVAAKDGLDVKVKVFSDYITPDKALADGDIDLNSYQHLPFLKTFNEKNHTYLVSIGDTYLAPIALYSHKYKNISDVPDGAAIAIPNDPNNGSRALLLLSKQGWITLRAGADPTKLTVQDIVANPKNIQITELEAGQLPRSLDDTAGSVINAGYAIAAKIPVTDRIATEDDTSPYVNVIAARAKDKDNPAYQKFVKAFQSPEVRQYIEENFKGELVPAWK